MYDCIFVQNFPVVLEISISIVMIRLLVWGLRWITTKITSTCIVFITRCMLYNVLFDAFVGFPELFVWDLGLQNDSGAVLFWGTTIPVNSRSFIIIYLTFSKNKENINNSFEGWWVLNENQPWVLSADVNRWAMKFDTDQQWKRFL